MGIIGRHKMVVRATYMAEGEEISEVVGDVSLDVCLSRNEITNFILEISNPIPPPLINGRGMKEESVCIPLCEPGDSGFGSQKFFTFKETIIVVEEFILQVVEE